MYHVLDIPSSLSRPWVYANFVMTLDGKVAITSSRENYWPLGSTHDYNAMMHLRAQADVLVHGRKTAQVFRALTRLEDGRFQAQRKEMGKPEFLPYVILSKVGGDDCVPFLTSSSGVPTYLATLDGAIISPSVKAVSSIIRSGETSLDVASFVEWCRGQGYQRILLEGGPTSFYSFLKAGYIDDLFLTIAPKLVGGGLGQAQTLLDGDLFSLKEVKRPHLVSCQRVEDELFLHYRFTSLL
ncbi:RibD family protein [Patescibacteria group bacterium]|nr:RibD family protein [Patescibacteria group bacterium]MBP9710278.1 RibD family protein [Patescibacteria group bacterium]